MNVVYVVSDMVHCIIYSIVKGNDAFLSAGAIFFSQKNFFSLKRIA